MKKFQFFNCQLLKVGRLRFFLIYIFLPNSFLKQHWRYLERWNINFPSAVERVSDACKPKDFEMFETAG